MNETTVSKNIKHEVFAKVIKKDGTIEDLGLIATTAPIKHIKLDIVAKINDSIVGTIGSILLNPDQNNLNFEVQATIIKEDESIKNIGVIETIPKIDINNIMKKKG